LLPTSLELAGVAINNLPGQSLSYLWNGSAKKPETYFWEHVGNKAMRKGNWKIVKDVEDAAWELYNMSTDLTESNNLANTNTSLLNEMIAEYEVWAKKNGVQVFVKGKSKAD
jgi:arylsulfatase A-like enzyme